MAKREYSTELSKLLEFLKTKNPTQIQNRMSKTLNEEEGRIYLKALKKKDQEGRKKLFRLINNGIHKKI